jgi:hypothetical protein
VSFNGVSARIISQAPASVVAEVPVGATDGRITITSPRGSKTTRDPFTVKGVRVTPTRVTVPSGRTVQFNAEVSGLVDKAAQWSVNTFTGGNNAVGTITQDGLYLPPNVPNGPAQQFVVRATSASEPALLGESQVTVINPGSGYELFSPLVSVRYGAKDPIAPALIFGAPVSVRIGVPPNVISAPTFGSPVSVRIGLPSNVASAQSYTAVSVTTGPVISALSPGTISRGATATLAINGTRLTGANAIKFINSDGSFETKITASNIITDAGGTSITATVTVNASITPGRRVVWVITPAGRTLLNDTGLNIVEVVP